jgi:NADH-quinone oxidoreductase subunit J
VSAAALAVPAVLEGTGTVSTGETVLFWVIAPIMVLGALGLIFARRAVHAALAVVVVMVGLAFLYTALEAPFLGVAQVVVYTGAVMMLFLFVLMLVGVDASDSFVETLRGQRWIAVVGGLGLLAVLGGVVLQAALPDPAGLEAANADTNPVGVARLVFGEFVFAFQLTGALLITAALGALTLTHRQRLTRRVRQREIAEHKITTLADTGRLTPLPAPGVYARHNAADVPALDAAGRPVQESVPRVLRIRGQERPVPDVDVREIVGRPEPPPGAPPEQREGDVG